MSDSKKSEYALAKAAKSALAFIAFITVGGLYALLHRLYGFLEGWFSSPPEGKYVSKHDLHPLFNPKTNGTNDVALVPGC